MSEREGRTGQLPIELILLRQVASSLDLPIFLIDAAGDLVYFNEPAEPLLGTRFDDVGELSMADWLARFQPRTSGSQSVTTSQVPLVIALREGRAVHSRLTITGLDRVPRAIETTALPLRGHGGVILGAIAIFWSSP